VRNQLADLAKRLEDRNIDLVMDDSAVEHVLNESYTPEYGARPIKRFLERVITTDISRRLISGDLTNNNTLNISAVQGSLSITIIPKLVAQDTGAQS
jgi:ATP-dependent Clp protease ATP-binding subunit ClpB